MPPNCFKSRQQTETLAVGRKRTQAAEIRDAERKKCGKVLLPDAQRVLQLAEELKEKCEDEKADGWTVWHMQLKLSKEMVLTACRLLKFLDEVSELEELAMDAESDMIPLLDAMINDCQDAIVANPASAPPPPTPSWPRDTARDVRTNLLLDNATAAMGKATCTVFSSKRWLQTDERYDLLRACCALFEAAEHLAQAAAGDGEFVQMDERLEELFEGAVSKCDDQAMDEYWDVDCEHGDEEEEENEEGEDSDA
jgi:hypothetical protein